MPAPRNLSVQASAKFALAELVNHITPSSTLLGREMWQFTDPQGVPSRRLWYWSFAAAIIRTVLKADSEIVSKLLNQLGYQAAPALIRDKLEGDQQYIWR